MNLKLPLKLIMAVILLSAVQSCAPVYSELQTAKTVGKNNVEIIPSATVSYLEGDYSQNEFGAQLAYGINDELDLRFRYVIIHEWGMHELSIAPKFSVKKDKIALNLLMGTRYDIDNSEFEFFNFQPSLLFTTTPKENIFDLTIAPKLLIFVNDDIGILPAINFNVSLSSNLKKWGIRPEVGVLWGGVQTSLAFYLTLGKN